MLLHQTTSSRAFSVLGSSARQGHVFPQFSCTSSRIINTYKYSLITVINQRTKTFLEHFRLNLIFNILVVLLLQDLILSVQVYEEKIWLLRHIQVTDL